MDGFMKGSYPTSPSRKKCTTQQVVIVGLSFLAEKKTDTKMK